jgi:hypothetical protein
LAIERNVVAVDVRLDAVVDHRLSRQRLGFKLRELKSVVLELDQRSAERFGDNQPPRASCSINW